MKLVRNRALLAVVLCLMLSSVTQSQTIGSFAESGYSSGARMAMELDHDADAPA